MEVLSGGSTVGTEALFGVTVTPTQALVVVAVARADLPASGTLKIEEYEASGFSGKAVVSETAVTGRCNPSYGGRVYACSHPMVVWRPGAGSGADGNGWRATASSSTTIYWTIYLLSGSYDE